MLRSLSLFSLLSLPLLCITAVEPSLAAHNVHEKRRALPYGWSFTKRYDAASTIPMRFALKQSNIDLIGTYLYNISHPKSLSYGKYWSAGGIIRTFAPSNETVDVVRSWLVASGIAEHRISLGHSKGWMRVNVTVGEAEQLMNTEYNVYTHMSGQQHVACEAYYLPGHVQLHVDFVTPLVHFDAMLTQRSSNKHKPGPDGASMMTSKPAGTTTALDELEHCGKHTTPICLRTLYGLFYKPVATEKNSYGIVEYSPNAYLESDLEMFARNLSTDLIGKEPHLVSIDGGYAQTINRSFAFNGESGLDLQYGMSLVTGDQAVTLYQTGDMVESGTFNNFLDALNGSYCNFQGGDDPEQDSIYPDPQYGGYKGPEACGAVKPTYVISTSYHSDEFELTPFYTERQCIEYAKLGLMGITLLFSSGDRGVAGNNDICINSNGTESVGGSIFNPSFPGTCPYITTVGATMLKPNGTVFDPETACTVVIYSGGGFSNHFAVPDYQKDAVDHYLAHYRPNYPPTIWNSTGTSRAYPDISANGENYIVVVDGGFVRMCGTSCSTPTVGAILTMINDARLAANKSTIGFINPAVSTPLRTFAGAFHDITNGTNPGCGTEGFNATIGWDPVTGLETPSFPELLKLWLALP